MQRTLVIDSGVGGLSVVGAIRATMPDLAIIYIADNAWFPYGKRSEAELTARLIELVESALEAFACEAVVVACNTASTVVLDALRARFTLPVVGVVPPIKTAGEVSKSRVIGLLATEATVLRPYVKNLVEQFAVDCRLISIGSARLAEMAEEKLRGEVVDRAALRDILQPFFGEGAPPVDTVVLGCTHYPLLLDELQSVSPEGVRWLDSSPAIARRLAQVLAEQPKPAHRLADHVLFTARIGGVDDLAMYLRGIGLPPPERFPS
ncbi:MAG TPA: glutamate racemase [Burkholderiales bacterium]|nr:glutamate racemase [Burkholderiales bacterium]